MLCLGVVSKPRQCGGPGPLGVVAPLKKENAYLILEQEWCNRSSDWAMGCITDGS